MNIRLVPEVASRRDHPLVAAALVGSGNRGSGPASMRIGVTNEQGLVYLEVETIDSAEFIGALEQLQHLGFGERRLTELAVVRRYHAVMGSV